MIEDADGEDYDPSSDELMHDFRNNQMKLIFGLDAWERKDIFGVLDYIYGSIGEDYDDVDAQNWNSLMARMPEYCNHYGTLETLGIKGKTSNDSLRSQPEEKSSEIVADQMSTDAVSEEAQNVLRMINITSDPKSKETDVIEERKHVVCFDKHENPVSVKKEPDAKKHVKLKLTTRVFKPVTNRFSVLEEDEEIIDTSCNKK